MPMAMVNLNLVNQSKLNSEFDTLNCLPKIYVDSQVNNTCNVEDIYGKSCWNNDNKLYISHNSANHSLIHSRACSCPYCSCLCNVTVISDYPYPISDVKVNVNDSLQYKRSNLSECSLDVVNKCSNNFIYLKSDYGATSEPYYTIENRTHGFMDSQSINRVGIPIGSIIWFTNTSSTCNTKQDAFQCQVGARYDNTHLGFLDHASKECTNRDLHGAACGVANNSTKVDSTYDSNYDNNLHYSEEKWLKNYIDQGVDLTDLGFQPHNYISQEFNSFKNFSVLSNSCISTTISIKILYNTYLGDTGLSNSYGHNDSILEHKSELNNDTVSQVVDSHVQSKVAREFGFIPDSIAIHLPLQTSTDFQYTLNEEGISKLHSTVKAYNVPNYKGARIPVISGLKIQMWRYILKDYDLQIIGDYLQYGFPFNVDRVNFEYNQNVVNHASSLRNPNGVIEYFNTEIQHQAMVGPMKESPFPKTHYSPIMARSKPDGSIRVIVDLSWPIGQGVNNYVPGDKFDDISFTLKYPTIDLVVEKIREMGPNAQLFKVDLQRAFRNLRIDPLDYPLLGLKWQENTYIDVALAFGFKNGAAACQLCTDVITNTLRHQKIWLMNYLDDYIGIAQPHQAEGHFQSLLNILDQVGLPVNNNKVEPPSSIITCLGIQINAKTGTLSVPDKKLNEIKNLTSQWLIKKIATRKQLQSYIGKLIAIHRCVKPSR